MSACPIVSLFTFSCVMIFKWLLVYRSSKNKECASGPWSLVFLRMPMHTFETFYFCLTESLSGLQTPHFIINRISLLCSHWILISSHTLVSVCCNSGHMALQRLYAKVTCKDGRNTCSCISSAYIHAPFLHQIHKTQHQSLSYLMGKQIKKFSYMHTMETIQPLKMNEIMPFATVWMDLEATTLSEISQTQEDKFCIMSHVE